LVAATTSFPHIKSDYYFTMTAQNPAQIVPKAGEPFALKVPFCRRKLGVRESALSEGEERCPSAIAVELATGPLVSINGSGSAGPITSKRHPIQRTEFPMVLSGRGMERPDQSTRETSGYFL
jgi:hypothetical protein